MRTFSSYGPVDKDENYYVPRTELVQKAYNQLIGKNPAKGGHYITIWAPRQCGKSWIMQEVLWKLMKDNRFHTITVNLEHLKMLEDTDEIIEKVADRIITLLNLKNIKVTCSDEFELLFKKDVLDKPLILIMDEFDALAEDAISSIAGVFRNVYHIRKKDPNPSEKKEFLLHSVALIGVRSVLGIENTKGSPFNVQRSLHIPELTYEETDAMFKCYEKESGHKVEQELIDNVYKETKGQPGLVSWFGELLTEGFEYFQPDMTRPLNIHDFQKVYAAAIQVLPNNNILNIISKAKQKPYKNLVLELFKTHEKILFKFDDKNFNFLYMNGVIDVEQNNGFYIKFPCPFVQKRLFNYFSHELFHYMGRLFEPFEDVDNIVTETSLNVKKLMQRYEKHLQKNRDWMLKHAPRRSDMKIYEAVFHFNLYEYLMRFFESYQSKIWPEFPTGNGKVDIFIEHGRKTYALEIKSYRDKPAYKQALSQAAKYAGSLNLDIIYLVVFVEYINEQYRKKYEIEYRDEKTGVRVEPVFVTVGD